LAVVQIASDGMFDDEGAVDGEDRRF